jgi:formate/nitrite transporter FocA (FNT family)
LASGIPAMHASLFIASFYTLYFTAVDVDDNIAYAFHFLRWGHLLTWILLMIVS